MIRYRRGLTGFATLLLPCLLGACGTKKVLSDHEYFENATANFRKSALAPAIEEYRSLLDHHPFSEFAEEAELRIAFAHYLDGSYAEAVVALTDFQRRHPTSPHLAAIGYLLGKCYARQMLGEDRDQAASQNAQTYFLTVTRQFPESPFAELARGELAACRDRLARHELHVAQFYERRGKQQASELRYLQLAALYGDTEPALEALQRLARRYERSRQPEQAALAHRAITELRPGSAEAIEAQRALLKLATPQPASLGQDDAVGTLLAGLGRTRGTTAFESAQLPTLNLPRMGGRSSGMPGLGMAPFDPFGRGRTYY